MIDAFIKTYADRPYRHVTMVQHAGSVIALAMDDRRRVFYAVLTLDDAAVQQPLDAAHWPDNPRELRFPAEIAEVGYGVAGERPLPPPATSARLSADAPFQAVSDNRYIYLFRQSVEAAHPDNMLVEGPDGTQVPIVDSTLLCDRFVLSGDELVSKMEVRYQRSRSKHWPQSRKDSLGARDMEDRPFFEPTQELRFIRNLSGGRFAALILPTQVAGVQRWQFFAHNAASGQIEAFDVEQSADGLFNTRGSQFFTCPDHPAVFALAAGTCGEPSLADPTQTCGKALVPIADERGFAQTALSFDGANTFVALPTTDRPTPPRFTLELWVRPNAVAGEMEGLAGSDEARPELRVPSLFLAEGNRLVGGFGDGAEWRSVTAELPLPAGQWSHVALTFNGRLLRLYVDGRLAARSRDLSGSTPAPSPLATLGRADGTRWFAGELDEVRLWERARPAAELALDLHRRLVGEESGLLACWRFDENAEAVARDMVAGRDGTVQAPAWVPSDAPIGDSAGVSRISFGFDGRTVQAGMHALLYYQQERASGGYDGGSKPLKRGARVMLAVPTNDGAPQNAGKNHLAVLDFAVSRSGKLAQIPAVLPLAPVGSDGGAVNDSLDAISTLEQEISRLKDQVNALNGLPNAAEIWQQVGRLVDALHLSVRRNLNRLHQLQIDTLGSLMGSLLVPPTDDGTPLLDQYKARLDRCAQVAGAWLDQLDGWLKEKHAQRDAAQSALDHTLADPRSYICRIRNVATGRVLCLHKGKWPDAMGSDENTPADNLGFDPSHDDALFHASTQWEFMPVGDDIFYLYNYRPDRDAPNGNVLDHKLKNDEPISPVYGKDERFPEDNQRWHLAPDANGEAAIRSAMGRALTFDADSGNVRATLNVADGDAQRWRLERINHNPFNRYSKAAMADLYAQIAALDADIATLTQERATQVKALDDFGLAQRALVVQQGRREQLLARLTQAQSELERAKGAIANAKPLSMPVVHVDPFGLTVSGALLPFAWTSDAPLLFDSATGQIALYFRGTSDQFFVAYYDTLTQKALFQLPASAGNLACIARSAEAGMEGLRISVADGADAAHCTLTLAVELGGRTIAEIWRNLPRAPRALADALNGLASERTHVGTVALTAGQTDTLAIAASDTEGVRGALPAGATLLLGERRLTLRAAVQKGARALPILPATFDAPANAPIATMAYDDADRSRTPAFGANTPGSALVAADGSSAAGLVANGEYGALPDASAPSCRWVTGAPGMALRFDGEAGYATLAPGLDASRLAADGDLTVETWVSPGVFAGRGRLVTQHSPTSRYTLGLERAAIGSALALDEAHWLDLGWRDGLRLGGAWTLEAWIKPEVADDDYHGILGGSDDSAVGSSRSPSLWVFEKTKIHGGFGDGANWNSFITENEVLTPQAWNHVALAFDGSTMRLHVNGIVQYESSAFAGRVPASTPIRWIGRVDNYFKGALDEVRVWGVARTPSEINANSQRRLGGNETGLRGYWHFDSALVHDRTRNGNDAIAIGPTQPAPGPLAAYRVFAGVGERCVASDPALIAGTWSHLAMVYRQAYALEFDGSSGALDAGSDITLDIGRDLTLEVALSVGDLSQPRGLLSRGQPGDASGGRVPYALHLSAARQLVFSFETGDGRAFSYASDALPIAPGTFCRLAVSRERVVEGEGASAAQFDRISFYLNGGSVGVTQHGGPDAGSSDGALEIGRAYLGDGQPIPFKGTLSEVRIWSIARPPASIAATIKGGETGLVAWWRFGERDGNIAYDSKANHHARIKGGVRRVLSPDPQGSALALYRDGAPLAASPTPAPDPGAAQFTLGASAGGSGYGELVRAQIDELRIWGAARGEEQLQDNLFRHLLDDRTDLLAYYTFDNDDWLADSSDRANRLTPGENNRRDAESAENKQLLPDSAASAPLRWNSSSVERLYSTAPISEDTPQARSALAGVRTAFHDFIGGRPAVQEYGDLQIADDGTLAGALKRCYAYVRDGRWFLITGFKVGDLVSEWVGQVQFKPQLKGFIEGAPPVPGENLTVKGVVLGEVTDYNGSSSVALSQAESTTYTYSAAKDKGSSRSIEMGASLGANVETLAGFLGTAMEKVAEVKVNAGVRFNQETTKSWLNDSSSGVGRTLSRLQSMDLRGSWENEDAIGDDAVGRRFIPSNAGFALVESETADVFALRLKRNAMLVSYQLRPNPDIPKDWNVITFPLNSQYVKQGTLDGRLGTGRDTNYPNADEYSSDRSYFKPIEAYALKKRIQQEEKDLETYYQQFDAARIGRREAQESAAKPPIKRNLANTYVWTSDGGLFAETEEALDTLQETIGGSYAFSSAKGVAVSADITVYGVNASFDFQALFGGHLNLQVTRDKAVEQRFGIDVQLDVERDIFRRDAQNKLVLDRSDPLNPRPVRTPGKVDAYRFMTFYLEPLTDHFHLFFNRVVDPIWLQQSDDPGARALREARDVERAPAAWRIAHRVTFVSRVLEKVGEARNRPALERKMAELDIDSNYELIKKLQPFVKTNSGTIAEFVESVRGAIDRYLPELSAEPLKLRIIEFMKQYFGIFEQERTFGDDSGIGDSFDPTALHPSVDAGPDLIVNLPNTAALNGSVSVDQLAAAEILTSWSVQRAPDGAQVTFSAPESPATTAVFDRNGVYGLRLTVIADEVAYDDVQVMVNQAPVIAAAYEGPALRHAAVRLVGSIRNDGLGVPDAGAITARWECVSGPGDVMLSEAKHLESQHETLRFAQSDMVVTARFRNPGTYRLRLSVSNGIFTSSAEIEVPVLGRVADGLEVLYTFEEGQGEIVHDVSGAAAPLDLRIGTPAAVDWNAGSLAVTAPASIASDEPATRLAQAIMASGELTVEAWLRPAQATSETARRIVTLSGGPGARDVTLGQHGAGFYAELRTSATNANASTRGLAAGAATSEGATHVVFTRERGGAARLYLNAQLAGERVVEGDLGAWDSSFALALAHEFGAPGEYAWQGQLFLAAIYSRALRPDEVQRNYDYDKDTRHPPYVSAGADQVVVLPAACALAGRVVGERAQTNPIAATWALRSGPAPVRFTSPNDAATTVTFDQIGRYVLALAASDDLFAVDDEALVVAHAAPTINARLVSDGPPGVVNLPGTARLEGAVLASGRGDEPAPPPTTRWAQIEGPAQLSFDAGALAPRVAFATVGRYVLRFSADNGFATSSADVAVVVNAAPEIAASAPALITLPAKATLSGTLRSSGMGEPGATPVVRWSKQRGPGEVTFADAGALVTEASFGASGTYVLRLHINPDGPIPAACDVAIVANAAPVVDAGPARLITLPEQAVLDGFAADDGLPASPGALSFRWEKVSGPGTVAFADAAADYTTASFSAGGIYVLRFTASDGAASASDDVQVTVNLAPVVSAGRDLRVTWPAPAELVGIVSDDGLPGGELSMAWSVVSGPGAVTFADEHAATTSATFSKQGAYVLRLTASDGAASASDDVQVHSYIEAPPVVTTGGRVRAGLLVLYPFHEGAGAIVHDVAGNGEPLNLALNAVKPDGSRWTDAGLVIAKPTLLVSTGPATKVIEAVRRTGELTLETWLTPRDKDDDTFDRIITLSANKSDRNITLGSDGTKFILHHLDEDDRDSTALMASAVRPGAVTHLVYTGGADGQDRLYVNGKAVASGKRKNAFKKWAASYRLALANELSRDRPWLGALRLVAIYERALTAEEVAQNFAAGAVGQL